MLDNREEPLLDAGEMNHPSRRIMNRILKLFEVQGLIMGQTNFRDGTLVSRERNRRGVDPEIPWRRHRAGVYQTSDLSSLSRADVLTTGLVTSVCQKDRKVSELAT